MIYAQIILDAGSDINACTGAPLNQTALCMAAQKGGLAITKLLLSKGANSNAGGYLQREREREYSMYKRRRGLIV